jgi:ABC-type lipoprotein export system ATPase subunit
MRKPQLFSREPDYFSNEYDMDIHVRDLSATNQIGKKVLDSARLYIPQGTHALVTGPSGAGKTVLATAIANLPASKEQLAYSGEVNYIMWPKDRSHGPVTVSDSYRVKKHNLGFVMQRPFFGEDMTAKDEILIDAHMKGIDVDVDTPFMQRVIRILDLDDKLDAHMTALSGGQQQRVMIAASLSTNPNVLVMDEPTSSLDLKSKQEVNDTVTNLVNELGITALMVTHDPLTAPHEIHVVDGKIVSSTLS